VVDPNDKYQAIPLPWDERVARIQARVDRQVRWLLFLGFTVYAGGSLAVLYFTKDRTLAMVLQMLLFQILVIYMSVGKVFRRIEGQFQISMAANRDMVPVFEDLASVAKKVHDAMEKVSVERLEAHLSEISSNIKAISLAYEKQAEKLPINRRPPAPALPPVPSEVPLETTRSTDTTRILVPRDKVNGQA
jgi:hypothetical protein